MPDDHPTSLRRLAGRVCATFVGVIVLYALSSGPAFLLATMTRSGDRFIMVIYTPLLVGSQLTRTAPALTSYLQSWVELGQRLRPPKEEREP